MPSISNDIELGTNTNEYQAVSSFGKMERKDSQEGTTLEWTHVSYAIPSKSKDIPDKQVLTSISGIALPGEILAIMGTSGAGKSTLLDVLAGRLDAKGLKGHITVNGSLINKKTFRKESGYVMQSDALFPLLTVRETFRYASYLRVPHKSRSEQREIAEVLIKLLRLDSCTDTIIGNDKVRGVSGGEKRRVSIGVDIVHQPKVIFLDEPTSGLDSSTAYSVVDSLKQLATVKKCTIVMTIHQPSARIFELIDKVTFLSSGQVTFFGDSTSLQPFVTSIYQELGYGNTGYANPPELFLDLSDRLLSENKIDVLISKSHDHERKSQMLSLPSTRGDLENLPIEVHYANSLVGDVMILMHRALINVTRTKELFIARFGATTFFGVLGGTLFLFPGDNDDGIFHKASFFILTLAYFLWNSLEALPIFYQERETFEREYASGAYRAISYTIATSLINFPFLFTLSFVYNVIAYWLLNLPNAADRFLFQVLIVFVVLVTANTFATTLSVLLPDPMTAQTIGSAVFAVMLVFSGFYISSSDIPDYWIYFHYMSFFKYGFDSLLVNGLQGYAFTPTKTNDQVLAEFSIDGMNKWQGIGILIGWTLFYRSIFYYRLTTAFNGSRKK